MVASFSEAASRSGRTIAFPWGKEINRRNNGHSVSVTLHSRRISLHFGSLCIWKRSYSHRHVFVVPGQQSGEGH